MDDVETAAILAYEYQRYISVFVSAPSVTFRRASGELGLEIKESLLHHLDWSEDFCSTRMTCQGPRGLAAASKVKEHGSS